MIGHPSSAHLENHKNEEYGKEYFHRDRSDGGMMPGASSEPGQNAMAREHLAILAVIIPSSSHIPDIHKEGAGKKGRRGRCSRHTHQLIHSTTVVLVKPWLCRSSLSKPTRGQLLWMGCLYRTINSALSLVVYRISQKLELLERQDKL